MRAAAHRTAAGMYNSQSANALSVVSVNRLLSFSFAEYQLLVAGQTAIHPPQ